MAGMQKDSHSPPALSHPPHYPAVNATGFCQVGKSLTASFIFLWQHQLPFRFFLHHWDIMFRPFVSTAAKDKPYCILKICNAHIFLHKLDDVPGFSARKLVISPSMLEQVQPTAVLYMDSVPVALLNLIPMFYGKIQKPVALTAG